MRTGRGFTVTELVVVILILGILAVVVLPRLFDRKGFDARSFYDDIGAAVRLAQKLAIASQQPIYVTVTGNTLKLCHDAACSQPVQDPAGGNFVRTAPAGVSLNGTSFYFDALGRPQPNADQTFSVVATGEPPRSLTVEKETGYAH